ncbi:MAG: type II toxin-antitoxin system VapB family antitoxin [Desulfamplus sp.]|nr:type II toxin-antitoxin system VapB family antitoxin [Desulfamplus sp.]
MRTNLNLPEKLLQEAMKLTCINRKNQVVIYALEELIKKSKIVELKKFKGKIDIEMNLDIIRGR